MCCGFSLTGNLPSAICPAGIVLGLHVYLVCPCQATGPGRECLTCTCIYVCMCVVSLTGDLPSAVWPAGFAVFVRVLWLFSDRRPTQCAVWPAGFAAFVRV